MQAGGGSAQRGRGHPWSGPQCPRVPWAHTPSMAFTRCLPLLSDLLLCFLYLDPFLAILSLIFSLCLFFYWSIIALQRCVAFCCPASWVSQMCTDTPSRPALFSHPPSPALQVITEHQAKHLGLETLSSVHLPPSGVSLLSGEWLLAQTHPGVELSLLGLFTQGWGLLPSLGFQTAPSLTLPPALSSCQACGFSLHLQLSWYQIFLCCGCLVQKSCSTLCQPHGL